MKRDAVVAHCSTRPRKALTDKTYGEYKLTRLYSRKPDDHNTYHCCCTMELNEWAFAINQKTGVVLRIGSECFHWFNEESGANDNPTQADTDFINDGAIEYEDDESHSESADEQSAEGSKDADEDADDDNKDESVETKKPTLMEYTIPTLKRTFYSIPLFFGLSIALQYEEQRPAKRVRRN